MVENGSSRGAEALPPNEPHPEFQALCALATSGSLNADERKRLNEHLSQCASCREVMAQYETVIGKVVPALGAAYGPASDADSSLPWSLEDAEASLFARLDEEDQGSQVPGIGARQEPRDSTASPIAHTSAEDTLWRHVWWQYAAGLLLIVSLGFALYRIGMRHGAESAREVPPTAPAAPSPNTPRSEAAMSTASPASSRDTQNHDSSVALLRTELDQQAREIAQLKTREIQLEGELSAKAADVERITQERADLTQQLNIAQTNLEDTQKKLNARTDQSAANAVQVASLEAKIGQLSDALHERDQDVARSQELLDHDRDIRELMGARDLYIAEVYDVAKTGDTQKPFGRVFYTQGKSLIFYAYDLDQQPGIKNASTFQAWGRRGPDRERAVNLGILYEDNTNKKRWVVKSHDPKTLGQIDAVFVTVEPNGGSSHPSGKPLLFAYLRVGPNHP